VSFNLVRLLDNDIPASRLASLVQRHAFSSQQLEHSVFLRSALGSVGPFLCSLDTVGLGFDRLYVYET
jgi:hypothetical protein